MLVSYRKVAFTALKDGTWGLKFTDPDARVVVPMPGTAVDVPKSDGTTRNLKVGEVDWVSDDGRTVLTRIDGKSSRVKRTKKYHNPNPTPKKRDPQTISYSAAGFTMREGREGNAILVIKTINDDEILIHMSPSRQEELFGAVFDE